MREIQEDFYLVLFMFANQLYFYVLGPSNLLGYQYFNIWKQVYFCNKAIRVSYTNQNYGLVFPIQATYWNFGLFSLVLALVPPQLLTPSSFLDWCSFQAKPKCYRLGHIPLFSCSIVLVVLRQCINAKQAQYFKLPFSSNCFLYIES